MKIGIPREIHPDERRVAVNPAGVSRLRDLGFRVLVEHGAGEESQFSDEIYAECGARIVTDTQALWSDCDIMLKVRPPRAHPVLGSHEADLLQEGGMLIGLIWPERHPDLLERLARRSATVFAMDCVPRISRAQGLDVLSAMANVAGYRAIIEAAYAYPHFFGGQMTAAGRIDPAKILVIGGGVAGLSAIGAGRGLGAVVRAFDTRVEVKEQVESMGGEFLHLDFKEKGAGTGGYGRKMSAAFLDAERDLFAQQAMEVDIIITTASVPGGAAPSLITAGMVESMKEGSVIVDLAAEQGGNCVLTRQGKKIVHHGVTIIGYNDLPSRMPTLSSRLYGNAMVEMMATISEDGRIVINEEDRVIRGSLVLRDGMLTWPPPASEPDEPPDSEDTSSRPGPLPGASTRAGDSRRKSLLVPLGMCALVLIMLGAGTWLPDGAETTELLGHLTVFVLACFVGWQLVWNVKPALHTPLMSVTNAISGIIIIGGMLHMSSTGEAGMHAAGILGAAAVLLASINIVGGFLVTQRMLGMFRR